MVFIGMMFEGMILHDTLPRNPTALKISKSCLFSWIKNSKIQTQLYPTNT